MLFLHYYKSIILSPHLPKLVMYWLNYTFLDARTYTIQLCLAKKQNKENLMDSYGVILYLNVTETYTGFINKLTTLG